MGFPEFQLSLFYRKMINQRLLKRYCSESLEQIPFLYVQVMRLRLRNTRPYRKIISKDSMAMVEGFPRCANSFALSAFKSANPPGPSQKIATHLHSWAHVLAGLKMGIPVLVLIRRPEAAVPSLLALATQLRKLSEFEDDIVQQRQLIRYWTGYYARFYEHLYPHRDRFVLGRFEQVTSDFNEVIMAMNHLFGSNFNPFVHNEENVRNLFDSADVHLSPSEDRDILKQVFIDAYQHRDNAKNRDRANAAYQAITVDS